ncbi:MAG: hypothetical protein IKO19_05835, partial [Candidatus Riflebacteria bacterium]|nr:hypothetical protein [Candidatus Riflebacteria bacterium]
GSKAKLCVIIERKSRQFLDFRRPLYDSLAILALACTPNLLLVVVLLTRATSPNSFALGAVL